MSESTPPAPPLMQPALGVLAEGRRRLWFGAVALAFGAVTLALLVADIDGLPRGHTTDRPQYEAIAFNLIHHGKFHDSPYLHEKRDADDELKPYMRRELGFPLYLAAIYATVPGFDELSFDCLRSAECEAAVPARQREQWVTAIVGAVTVALTFIAASALTGSLPLATMAGLLCLTLLPGSDGELLAGLLLMGHAALAAAVWRKPRVVTAVASGVALGLLVLTKAIFQYWLMALALACLIALWRDAERRRSLTGAFAAMLLAGCCVSVPWMVRNAVQPGHFGISLRGGEILAIRAEYGRMTWSEVSGAFAYWLPGSGLRTWAMRWLEPEVHGYARFDRNNPEGFYGRAKMCTGEVAARAGLFGASAEACRGLEKEGFDSDSALSRAALSFMREDWLKQAVLTAAFAARGSKSRCRDYGNAQRTYGNWAASPARFMCRPAVALGYLLLPVLGALSVLAWKRRNGALVFLILPVVYGFGLHAAATHFIPRYGEVFVPVFAVMLALAVWEILRRPKNLAP